MLRARKMQTYPYNKQKMHLYANAKLVASGKKEFLDKEGNQVEYYENILKSTDGEISTVNSQADYTGVEGKTGIATLRLKDSGRVSLLSFNPNQTFEIPEVTLDIT